MTCVECGMESTFWLCSNACALAYAKKRGRRDCAICSYDPATGRIGRHDTTKICAECRRHSENAEWVHRKREEADERIEKRDESLRRLREMQEQPLPPVGELLASVAKMVVEGERVAYVYRDSKGRRRGLKYRLRAYTIRRLAKKLRCPRAFIQRIVRSIES